jgi:hypothetical protein
MENDWNAPEEKLAWVKYVLLKDAYSFFSLAM